MRNNPNIITNELHQILMISEPAVKNNLTFLKENGYIEKKRGDMGDNRIDLVDNLQCNLSHLLRKLRIRSGCFLNVSSRRWMDR